VSELASVLLINGLDWTSRQIAAHAAAATEDALDQATVAEALAAVDEGEEEGDLTRAEADQLRDKIRSKGPTASAYRDSVQALKAAAHQAYSLPAALKMIRDSNLAAQDLAALTQSLVRGGLAVPRGRLAPIRRRLAQPSVRRAAIVLAGLTGVWITWSAVSTRLTAAVVYRPGDLVVTTDDLQARGGMIRSGTVFVIVDRRCSGTSDIAARTMDSRSQICLPKTSTKPHVANLDRLPSS
jgi:hypothetical protein